MDEKPILKNTRFDTRGIRSALGKIGFSKSTYYKAIAEVIWNGFDAKATTIKVNFEIFQDRKEGYFRKLFIEDDGTGINYDGLHISFEPIFDSEKLTNDYSNQNLSASHGKNGVGRLTFFTFANRVRWDSIYSDKNKSKSFSIGIDATKLNKFIEFEKPTASNKSTGTIATFDGFEKIKSENIQNELIGYLAREFCWFLELNSSKKYSLLINNKKLDYSFLVEKRNSENFSCDKHDVELKYIKWNCLLNKEYSKFYFINSENEEVWKENTKLNNQGDDFYHSVFIKSEYFNTFNFKSSEEVKQKSLVGGSRSDSEFIDLLDKVYSFLKKERKPFLEVHSEKILTEYKNEGIIKSPKKDSLEAIETQELENVFKELYKLQPKFFTKLTKEQKKIFVNFMDTLLKSNNREEILRIVDEIVQLTDEEKKELSDLLQVTKFNKIIKTISLLKERYEVVQTLRKLVFDPKYGANERDHIQKIIECNYWLFGEQFNLVTKDEPFQKSLEKYLYLLDGKTKSVKFEGEHKNKRMDIFMCKRKKEGQNTIHNVIVELKSPSVKLGSVEYLQVDKYKTAILDEPEFKSNHANWTFNLVSSDFASDKFIDGLMKSNQNHGERNLIFKADNFKIYAKRWCDIFDEFELNHDFLNQKLELEKESLVQEFKDAAEATKRIMDKNGTN